MNDSLGRTIFATGVGAFLFFWCMVTAVPLIIAMCIATAGAGTQFFTSKTVKPEKKALVLDWPVGLNKEDRKWVISHWNLFEENSTYLEDLIKPPAEVEILDDYQSSEKELSQAIRESLYVPQVWVDQKTDCATVYRTVESATAALTAARAARQAAIYVAEQYEPIRSYDDVY